MKVQYTYSPEYKSLIGSGKEIQRVLPTQYKNILLETADVIWAEADAKVHVVTGRTKASGSITIPSATSITVTYAFGGIWEERRGGLHAFLHMGVTKGQKEMSKIILKYIIPALQDALTGKNKGGNRTKNYISRHKSSTTGQWVYRYADTGRATRSTGGSRGGGRR